MTGHIRITTTTLLPQHGLAPLVDVAVPFLQRDSTAVLLC
jgi:hypothetical protein